jgi:phosphocarrier protein HPr
MSPSSDGGRSTVEIPVRLPAHLHARPAGRVVRAAAGFTAVVDIRYGERSAPARSVLALMALGATAGATVVVHADGDDAETAASGIAAVLAAAE